MNRRRSARHLRKLLEPAGAVVTTCGSAEEGLVLAEQEHPDAYLAPHLARHHAEREVSRVLASKARSFANTAATSTSSPEMD